MNAWNRICCATDFSAPGHAAEKQAASLARALNAELTLLHVHQGQPSRALEMLGDPSDLDAAGRAEIDRMMETARSTAEQFLGRGVAVHVAEGVAAEQIVSFARAHAADALVMGTHGRRGLSHLVLGSVAERVIREAPCPVVVVRAARRESSAEDLAEAGDYR